MSEPFQVASMDNGRNVRCPRCWHWHGIGENFDSLCDDCQRVIVADYPEHPSAAAIRKTMKLQKEKYTHV